MKTQSTLPRTSNALAMACAAALCAGCGNRNEPASVASRAAEQREYRRIVSLAPSVTEILFALGMGERVVGVTRYCLYPPEAQTLPRIGGHLDPNYEAIVALDPDLIILLREHEATRKRLETLGRETLVVSHRTLSGVLDSIGAIGRTGLREREARETVAEMRRKLRRIEDRTARQKRPKVLVTVGRPLGGGRIEDVYIAGRDGFYEEMIKIAGGRGAYRGTLPYPKVSLEGIIAMKPDVIIDMVSGLADKGLEAQDVANDWRVLPGVPAIENGRVYVLDEDFATIPGPRCVQTVEEIARVLHPKPETGR